MENKIGRLKELEKVTEEILEHFRKQDIYLSEDEVLYLCELFKTKLTFLYKIRK